MADSTRIQIPAYGGITVEWRASTIPSITGDLASLPQLAADLEADPSGPVCPTVEGGDASEYPEAAIDAAFLAGWAPARRVYETRRDEDGHAWDAQGQQVS